MRALLKLTWLEIKIFIREPLGVIGAVVIPVAVFLLLGRILGEGARPGSTANYFLEVQAPIFAALLILLTAVLSLITVIAIYREGGILNRLRATPLRVHTILTAQVLVKLLLTGITLLVMLLAGRRYYPVVQDAPLGAFAFALLLSGIAVLAMGFVIASLVPTARFAQPIGAAILYPMVAVSGLFIPLELMPPALALVARALPLTYVVSLLQGIWTGGRWLDHVGDLAALTLSTVVCLAISARVFRWE